MECSTKSAEPYAREIDIHTSCLSRYAELQSRYDHKKIEMIGHKTKANYWEAQFRQLKTREEELLSEVEELKAKLRKREQELFGKSTEKSNKIQDKHLVSKQEKPKKNRGQQPGSKGHGRRDYNDLPIELEELEFAEESCKCRCCDSPYIVGRSVAANHWHADETGWKVFEALEGKKNHNWYLWIFHNTETVVYKIHPTRSSEVLIEYFDKEHSGGTLNVDRYSAYKAIAKNGLFILAFCWAHVRRDFLNHAKGYVKQETWALAWVDRIGKIYHINNERIAQTQKSKLFHEKNRELKKAISEMKRDLTEELANTEILPSAKKLLESLNRHWSGLTIFVDRPEIPMDNNRAERGL
jgi:hypothetical protein